MADDLTQNPPSLTPALTAVPDDLPSAGQQPAAPSFQDASVTSTPTQPVVPVEPVSSTLTDAWARELAAPQGQINPAVPSALPDSAVFASSAPVELVPPLATQLPQQAPEAQQAVVDAVTTPPTSPMTSFSDLMPLVPPAQPTPPATPSSEDVAPFDPGISLSGDSLPPAQDTTFASSEPSSPPEVSDVSAESPELPADEAVADGTEADGEDKKTPLEILEEILAGANAEKDLKEKEEAELKAKAEQEAAEFAAKEAAFAEEAKEKLAVTSTAIAEAVEQREKVEAQLSADNPVVTTNANLEIHQLTHDTIQSTE